MKRPLLLIIFFISFINSQAQSKQANNWAFGNYDGLSFSSGIPIPIATSLYSYEGCSSISDTSGSLLFYSNGNYVWDKNGNLMPNGTRLKGNDTSGIFNAFGTSSTQSTLIIKIPLQSNKYLLFTSSDAGYGYYYSTIDMALNNGLGDVINKNMFLYAPSTEKLCAVNHNNDTNIWVMTHKMNSNEFVAYKIDSTGVNLTPIISQGDTVFTMSPFFGSPGQIKFSTTGKKLGCANWDSSVSLYDFNSSTGVLSNAIQWNLPNSSTDKPYGIEFSPNDTFLYVGSSPGGNLFQYNISSNNVNTISQSVYNYNIPYTFSSGGQLQLAIDGKIYYSSYTDSLSVINAPNYTGILSSYCDQCIITSSNSVNSGLPNFNQSYFVGVPNILPIIRTTISETACDSYTSPSGKYVWTNSNTYIDTIPNSMNCDSIITINLIIKNSSSATISETACNSYTSPSGRYVWTSSNTYMDTITNSVNCDSILTINLTINNVDSSITQTGSLLSSNETGGNYQWLNCPGMTLIIGATNQSYIATVNGSYAVIVTNNGCSDTSACYPVTGVGIIENNFGNELLIYPNPTDKNFFIDLGGNYRTISITITNILGRTIQSNSYNESQLLNLNIEEPAGVYLLVIESVDKKAVIRLIKE